MNVARHAIPLTIRVLPSPALQQKIRDATEGAQFRLDTNRRAAELAAQALQWIDNEMLVHVLACNECRFHACRSMRAMRRASARADRSYQRALRRLHGGR